MPPLLNARFGKYGGMPAWVSEVDMAPGRAMNGLAITCFLLVHRLQYDFPGRLMADRDVLSHGGYWYLSRSSILT